MKKGRAKKLLGICIFLMGFMIFSVLPVQAAAPRMYTIQPGKTWTRYDITGDGKKDKIKPGDILGAIAGESGMPGRLVGAIDMFDKYTFVEVPREYGKEVLNAMKHAKIKGKAVNMEPANQK